MASPFFILVGTGGFEPPAPCSQGRCADQTALRPDYFYAESLKIEDLVSQGRVQCKMKKHRAWGIGKYSWQPAAGRGQKTS